MVYIVHSRHANHSFSISDPRHFRPIVCPAAIKPQRKTLWTLNHLQKLGSKTQKCNVYQPLRKKTLNRKREIVPSRLRNTLFLLRVFLRMSCVFDGWTWNFLGEKRCYLSHMASSSGEKERSDTYLSFFYILSLLFSYNFSLKPTFWIELSHRCQDEIVSKKAQIFFAKNAASVSLLFCTPTEKIGPSHDLQMAITP